MKKNILTEFKKKDYRSALFVIVIVFLLTAITQFIKPPSCDKVYDVNKQNYNKAANKNDYKNIYADLKKHSKRCRLDKKNITRSVNYSYIEVVSGAYSGSDKSAVELAKSTSLWLRKNTKNNYSDQSTFSQIIELKDFSEGYVPASFGHKLDN